MTLTSPNFNTSCNRFSWGLFQIMENYNMECHGQTKCEISFENSLPGHYGCRLICVKLLKETVFIIDNKQWNGTLLMVKYYLLPYPYLLSEILYLTLNIKQSLPIMGSLFY